MTIHHKWFFGEDAPTNIIDISKLFVVLAGAIPTTDTVDIDVTPGTMDWTASKVDTGDGTAFFYILPVSGTGDDTITIGGMSDNETGSEREGEVHISDDAGLATTRVITVTQMIKPA
jgi:hypothetical protein